METPKQYKYELLSWPDNANTVQEIRNYDYEILKKKPSYDHGDNYIRLNNDDQWSLHLRIIE